MKDLTLITNHHLSGKLEKLLIELHNIKRKYMSIAINNLVSSREKLSNTIINFQICPIIQYFEILNNSQILINKAKEYEKVLNSRKNSIKEDYNETEEIFDNLDSMNKKI